MSVDENIPIFLKLFNDNLYSSHLDESEKMLPDLIHFIDGIEKIDTGYKDRTYWLEEMYYSLQLYYAKKLSLSIIKSEKGYDEDLARFVNDIIKSGYIKDKDNESVGRMGVVKLFSKIFEGPIKFEKPSKNVISCLEGEYAAEFG